MFLRAMTTRITAVVGAAALGAAGAAVTVAALLPVVGDDADDAADAAATTDTADTADGGKTADEDDDSGQWRGARRWLADRIDDSGRWDLPGRLDAVPDAVRRDLADAWALDDPDARREAFEALGDRALAGDYGAEVRKGARQLRDRWESRPGLPDELRQDLEDAWDIQDADQRRDALDDIRDRVLAGDYGAEVKERAERLRDRVESLRDGAGRFWRHDD